MDDSSRSNIIPMPSSKPSLPACLDEWRIHEPLPATVTPEVLEGALVRYERALTPAGFEAMAVTLYRLLEFGQAFGIKCPSAEQATAIYGEALSDLPTDLLTKAVNLTVQTWTWGNRLPMPGEVRAHVADDLARRQREKSRVELALRQIQDGGKPYVSAFEQRWRDFVAAHKDNPPPTPDAGRFRAIPRGLDDDAEPADVRDSLRRGHEALATFRKVAKDPAA